MKTIFVRNNFFSFSSLGRKSPPNRIDEKKPCSCELPAKQKLEEEAEKQQIENLLLFFP